jgi:uncharacterized protein
MVRPRRCRKISMQPSCTYYKPRGIPLVNLEEVILTLDEFESIRLKDAVGYEQKQAAQRMGISQPTFFRLITSPQKKIAKVLVQEKALRIEGGSIKIEKNDYQGCKYF